MSAYYELALFDTTGVRQSILSGWKYFEYHQRISQPWNSILRLDLSINDPKLDFFRSTLTRDYILHAYRTDPVTGQHDRVYEGFHRTMVDQMLTSNIIELTLYGVGFTNLVNRRVVIPPVGSENSVKTGAAETVIKEYVDEACVSATDATRNFSGLSIEADAGVGSNVTYSARYTKLDTVIEKCAQDGNVQFGIVGGDASAPNTFEFQVREIWGTDRRAGNGVVTPMIFDPRAANMEIPILSRNGGNEVSFVYVGGQQAGVDRVIEEVSDAAAIAVSPWNRIEAFSDARRESTVAGLQTIGNAYLDKNKYLEHLTFNIRQTLGTRWLRDWALGDYVTARFFDYNTDRRINEVAVTVTAGAGRGSQIEVIQGELDDIP